jgi:hypothetical protein
MDQRQYGENIERFKDEIHLMLGEDVAIDGGICGKSFRGFNGICYSRWLSAFELYI